MSPISSSPMPAVQAASSLEAGTVQSVAAMKVMKMAINQQATAAAQLLESVQSPALATSGSLGTRLNAVA